MTYASCRAAWTVPGGHAAAKTLDEAFPGGACEIYSLADPQRSPIPDDELVARVITSPADYDESLNEILTAKLTNAYASGLSIIRTGSPDAEILNTIDRLMGAAGVQELVGAVVIKAGQIRCILQQFCVYDTDAPGLTLHGDIVGTFAPNMTNSAWKAEQKRRRKALRDRMAPLLIPASTPTNLLAVLRAAGL